MTTKARKITVTGRVQGVGYRPFVYVTAQELGIRGSVLNGSGTVFIHAEGDAAAIGLLEEALVHKAPPLARPRLASSEAAEVSGAADFRILASDAASEPEIHVPPDLFTCDDCLAELTDPSERRHGYPFINCTQCGPRYTLITAMPYDRPNTSMAGFPLCDACRAEYESPMDRRFHAQPLACAECGPSLEFVGKPDSCERSARGSGFSRDYQKPTNIRAGSEALLQAVTAIQQGAILAIKGVGGYHLVCDAADDAAVGRLRERKHRPHKPLAVMFPLQGEDGLDAVRACCELDEVCAAAITDAARPIVLAKMRGEFPLSGGLAPGLGELGVFLPYSPLHHELLSAFGGPLVATSGNISGEPVITDNSEATERLAGIADAFLHHDRPIIRPADDPVIRPLAGRARLVRPGRGIAPIELKLPFRLDRAVLATGGHMKNTVALAWADRVVVSPHVGELDSPRSYDIFKQVINDIQNLYDVKPGLIFCDLHPGYTSSRWAREQALPVIRTQHHAAHASSLAGEHPDVENWLVFTWDGVGLGDDDTLWGGEALAGGPGRWWRRASFRPFHLVGGDKAGREPWRSAAALLWETGREFDLNGGSGVSGSGFSRDYQNPEPVESSRLKPLPQSFAPDPSRSPGLDSKQLSLAHQAWSHRSNTFETTAAGRLFDAAAALVLGRRHASFEGQGPMELEQLAAGEATAVPLPLYEDDAGLLRADWQPLLKALTVESESPASSAAMFHESMARSLVDQALAIQKKHAFDAIGLSGGVFQNRRLTERAVELLGRAGFEVRLHREIPANDGGLCFGQVIEAAAKLKQ